MEKTEFRAIHPYQDDAMRLPVKNANDAVKFYIDVMGFELLSKSANAVILGRNQVKMGLEENGGDPTQDGCFIEVDNVERAYQELQSNGWNIDKKANFRIDRHGDTDYKVFFVVAPDGLCYCLGEKIDG